MKLAWGRIVLAALTAEIALLTILTAITRPVIGHQADPPVILIGGFVFMFLAASWVAGKVRARLLLHGVLVGVTSVVFYTVVAPGVTLRYLSDGNVVFIMAHVLKILGGTVGGRLAEQRAIRAASIRLATKT